MNRSTVLAISLALAMFAGIRCDAAIDGRATEQERITAANLRAVTPDRTWRGKAWRNERVHATFVVWGEPGTELKLSASALSGPGDARIEAVRPRQVLESLCDDWRMGQPKDWSKYPSYPVGEALDDELPVKLNDRGFRAVWVTVKTPEEAPPGNYRGELTVTAGPSDAVRLPIELEILPMTLPRQKRMYLDIWQTPWTIARYYGDEPFSDGHFRRLEPIYRELADAGQRAITLTMTDYPWNVRQNIDTARSMIPYVKGTNGVFRADFTLLDRYVAFCEKCGLGPELHFYALARFENGTSYWYTDEATGAYTRIVCKPGSKEFEDYWTPMLHQLEAHAAEKGWTNRVYVALDELRREDVKTCAELLAKCAPTFRFQMSGNCHPSAFKGIRIDSYSQQLSPRQIDAAFIEDVARRRAEGFRTTGYVCCNPVRPNCLVASPLHEARWLGLFLAAKGFDGFLKSTSHRWMQHVDPLIDTNCRPHFPCGDSFLLYPGNRTSVRWETLRDGWEDFDKLAILRERNLVTPALTAALANIAYPRFLSGDETRARADVAEALREIDTASVSTQRSVDSFNIVDFGAKGDGKTVNTSAIQAAVDAAAKAGGGKVVVPEGVFVSGTVWLRSHVELHLAEGAVLRGSTRQADYNANDAFPENFWSKGEQWSGGHLVLAYRVEDVAITGAGEGERKGTIDGNGPAFFGEYPDVDSYFPSYKYGCKEEPLDRVWFRPGPMVAMFLTKGIRVEGVRLARTPCWTMHVRCSEDVTIRRTEIAADRQICNSDGFSIDCTKNVLIEDSVVASGDDGIAIRASCRLHPAEHPCEHVRIRNCRVSSCACGVRIGVGSGTIRDVVIADSVFPESSRGVSFQPAWRAAEKNVYISDVVITNCAFYEESLPVRVTMPDGDSRVENVRITGCTFEGLEPNQVITKGNPKAVVRNVVFEDCTYRPIEKLKVCHNFLWMTYWEKKHAEMKGCFLYPPAETNGVTCVNCRVL